MILSAKIFAVAGNGISGVEVQKMIKSIWSAARVMNRNTFSVAKESKESNSDYTPLDI